MEEKYHLQTHPTEKAKEDIIGGCNYKKNLNNPKCFLNICNLVSFLKNMGILKVIITDRKRADVEGKQDRMQETENQEGQPTQKRKAGKREQMNWKWSSRREKNSEKQKTGAHGRETHAKGESESVEAGQASDLTRVQASPETGLTAAQVQERKVCGCTNEKVDSSTKTTAEIVKSNVFTYFNLIFLIIAILLILVGSFRDLTFLPIIIANTLIGIIQELRSKKVLDDLALLNTPKVTVIRDGKRTQVVPEELVLDDIIELSAGNQIPADAVVVSGMVTVNEALITGETDEIGKGEEEALLSGSFVVSGSCVARLEKVGKDAYIAGLMLQATEGEGRGTVRDDPFLKPSCESGWRYYYPGRCSSFCTAVSDCGNSVKGERYWHGSSNSRHDSGRALSVSECGDGCVCYAAWQTESAGA